MPSGSRPTAVLIKAAAITVANGTMAATTPIVFWSCLGRRKDGEYEVSSMPSAKTILENSSASRDHRRV
jgi:hypothetical protein